MIELVNRSRLDYEVMIHKNQCRKVMQWCEEKYGPRWEVVNNKAGIWCVFWAGRGKTDQYRFCFAHEQDAMWFTLHWGGQ